MKAKATVWILAVLGFACTSAVAGPEPPAIDRINNATAPGVELGATIEITGESFLWVPGHVELRQGSNLAYIVPDPSGWSGTSVSVRVPEGGDEGAFEVPGDLQVSVVTHVGASDEVSVALLEVPQFHVTELAWEPSATLTLPQPLRGHAAVSIPVAGGDSAGYIMVTGGNTGTENIDDVRVIGIDSEGVLDSTWRVTTSLPRTRAFHASAVAHQGNAPVPEGTAFVYVIGGQLNATSSPGGSVTTYIGAVDSSDGTVDTWIPGPDLPHTLLATTALIDKGYLYVIGGLQRDSNASHEVFVSKILEDGTLDDWTETEPLTSARHSAAAFADQGAIYLVGGDGGNRTDPNDQSEYGGSEVFRGTVQAGQVTAWEEEPSALITRRSKHALWATFGQVLLAGGVHPGPPDTLEMEYTQLSEDEAAVWDPVDDPAVQMAAYVFNGAEVVSPVRPHGEPPCLLLLGGQVLGEDDVLSDTIYMTSHP